MSTTFDIDELPTLPTSWTAPTSCFASTRYYRVLLGSGGHFSNLYGTPTPVLTGNAPTGDCFPPSFTIDVPYRTDGDCPAGYTRACATPGPERSGKPVSTVTCCPSVTGNAFSFMCRDHEYGCHGTGTVGAVWTGVITDIGIPTPTEEPVTRTPFTNEGIEAWGIKFISIASSTPIAPTTATPGLSSPTTATTTTTASAHEASPTASIESDGGASSAGLSTGAVAGIAIGAVAAVGIFALVAFLVYREKRRKQDVDNDYAAAAGGHYKASPPNGYRDRYGYPYPGGVNDGMVHEAPARSKREEPLELQG